MKLDPLYPSLIQKTKWPMDGILFSDTVVSSIFLDDVISENLWILYAMQTPIHDLIIEQLEDDN